MGDRPSDEAKGLAQARREADYYRRIAEEAGSRRLREAEALSRLLERAEQAEQELQIARDELELRVEERTRELSDANARLSREAKDRERAEAALRSSEEAFRSFMLHFPGLAFIKEVDTTVVFASEGFRTFLGLDPAAMVGKTNACCFAEPFASQITKDDQRVLQSGRPETIGEEFGGRKWTTHKFVIPRGDGPPRLGGLTLDVTDARRSEEERRRLERQMEQVQRTESLGVLAGGIAHDFNNLLATILANTAVLRTGGVASTDVDSCLADVEIAARTAAGLCQQMLAYAGRAPIRSELVDLSELVKDLMQLLRSALSRKLGLDLQLEDKLALVRGESQPAEAGGDEPRHQCRRGDGRRRRQRHRHHSPCARESGPAARRAPGRGAPRRRISPARGGGHRLRDGPGDPAPDFEPFFTSKFAGRGLGLSAVLGIVRQVGGAIEIDSAPGQGTRFRVLFPASAELEKKAQRPLPMANTWTGKGMVLVVDDEPAVRRAAGRLLSRIGFEMLEAAGGAEGVELFTAHAKRIRAVLLDLTMPHLDGVETFRRLRQLDPAVRVMVASGFSESEVSLRFHGGQPDAFVQKPFDLESMRAKLREVLDVERGLKDAG